MSISPYIILHLDGLDSPVEAWEKLTNVFVLINEIQAYHLEDELLTLDPSNFSSIEYYLSKFKTLKLLLEGCKVKKEDEPLIYGILVSYHHHTLSLYPLSIIIERIFLLQELSIEIPPLIRSMIS